MNASHSSGDQLFDLVQQYASLGDHQTGSEVDAATTAWMTSELERRGLRVTHNPVPFERSVATSEVSIDGEPIEHLVVPYEWAGDLTTTNVYLESIDPKAGGFSDVLDAPIGRAKASSADVAIFATQHPNGSLVAINRHISPGSGFPTLLIADRDLERATTGEMKVSMSASRQPGTTTNVIAHNDVPGTPVILTTPLTDGFVVQESEDLA